MARKIPKLTPMVRLGEKHPSKNTAPTGFRVKIREKFDASISDVKRTPESAPTSVSTDALRLVS